MLNEVHSGPLSRISTELSTRPWAWIMITLITDFIKNLEGFGKDDINGYLDAEKAKLVFHSTRGISTLLILEPLGLSTGIQPIYANLVNLEIYSRSKDDMNGKYSKYKAEDSKYGYDKYLFRFTNMGNFMPFPGCDKDYDHQNSTLCNLEILINRFNEYALYLKDWEPVCRNMTDKYYENPLNKDNNIIVGDVFEVNDGDFGSLSMHSNDDIGGDFVSERRGVESVWYLIVGLIIGAVIMWAIDRRNFIMNQLKSNKYHVIN